MFFSLFWRHFFNELPCFLNKKNHFLFHFTLIILYIGISNCLFNIYFLYLFNNSSDEWRNPTRTYNSTKNKIQNFSKQASFSGKNLHSWYFSENPTSRSVFSLEICIIFVNRSLKIRKFVTSLIFQWRRP